jgi:hypothetical protein
MAKVDDEMSPRRRRAAWAALSMFVSCRPAASPEPSVEPPSMASPDAASPDAEGNRGGAGAEVALEEAAPDSDRPDSDKTRVDPSERAPAPPIEVQEIDLEPLPMAAARVELEPAWTACTNDDDCTWVSSHCRTVAIAEAFVREGQAAVEAACVEPPPTGGLIGMLRPSVNCHRGRCRLKGSYSFW